MDSRQNSKGSLSESDGVRRRSGAYRRGARDKVKGTWLLVLFVIFLCLVVAAGIIFVLEMLIPVNVKDTNVSELKNISAASESSPGTVEEYFSQKVKLESGDVLNDDKTVSGIAGYCEADFDTDGNNELLSVEITEERYLCIEIFENESGKCVREGLYVFNDNSEDTDINIFIKDSLICFERLEGDDIYTAVFEYKDNLEMIFDSEDEEKMEENGFSVGKSYTDIEKTERISAVSVKNGVITIK